MPGRRSATFTEVELEFMQLIWEQGETTTEEMQRALKDQGRELADGSIRKIFSILIEKGHLDRRKEGRGYVYFPKTVRQEGRSTMLRDLLDRAFEGSVPTLVAALLGEKDVSQKDLRTIREMIERHEEGEK